MCQICNTCSEKSLDPTSLRDRMSVMAELNERVPESPLREALEKLTVGDIPLFYEKLHYLFGAKRSMPSDLGARAKKLGLEELASHLAGYSFEQISGVNLDLLFGNRPIESPFEELGVDASSFGDITIVLGGESNTPRSPLAKELSAILDKLDELGHGAAQLAYLGDALEKHLILIGVNADLLEKDSPTAEVIGLLDRAQREIVQDSVRLQRRLWHFIKASHKRRYPVPHLRFESFRQQRAARIQKAIEAKKVHGARKRTSTPRARSRNSEQTVSI